MSEFAGFKTFIWLYIKKLIGKGGGVNQGLSGMSS